MMSARTLLGLTTLVGGMMVTMNCTGPAAQPRSLLAEVAQQLPDRVGLWESPAETVYYTPDSLFDYIDGHAEVYRAYDLVACAARRYTGPDGSGDIVVDLFQLASAADAFGVFTHDLDGQELAIGQGALFRYGWLSFWKGPFFVSIYAEGESDEATAAVLELGRTAAAAISDEGSVPAIVEQMPETGLMPRSRRYLHHPTILAAHRPLSTEDVLQLGATGVTAALGRYDRGGGQAYLLLVDYPDVATADTAAARFGAEFLAGGRQPTEREDGWYAMAATGREPPQLAFVFGAADASLAERLLGEARSDHKKESP